MRRLHILISTADGHLTPVEILRADGRHVRPLVHKRDAAPDRLTSELTRPFQGWIYYRRHAAARRR